MFEAEEGRRRKADGGRQTVGESGVGSRESGVGKEGQREQGKRREQGEAGEATQNFYTSHLSPLFSLKTPNF